MGGFNVGDILFQLFSLIFIIWVVGLIVILLRAFTKRGRQLNRIEEQLNSITEELKKKNQ
ncbi:DUF4083 domain-containing protein [Rossellomorea aquimaris]|uniref:DUF4083 domain-containing protein n=1 Tax=Rossellomorea aquimaris TaxID=189382 RepID=UPI001CD321FC|nr:DUF4083 domain-containing protein [Rossellomorea aquimaris]MCA1054136.1 DUF4083 domain-containing protein [Rossellomorea aquimaris]